jgi:hypothetical protein
VASAGGTAERVFGALILGKVITRTGFRLIQSLRRYAKMLPSNAWQEIKADPHDALAQPEPEGPSDEELLALMPETMRDEFSYAAKVCSDVTGGQVKPGIFRVALNTAALEYAQAVLARWGNL